jgi:hypothetical protein
MISFCSVDRAKYIRLVRGAVAAPEIAVSSDTRGDRGSSSRRDDFKIAIGDTLEASGAFRARSGPGHAARVRDLSADA